MNQGDTTGLRSAIPVGKVFKKFKKAKTKFPLFQQCVIAPGITVCFRPNLGINWLLRFRIANLITTNSLHQRRGISKGDNAALPLTAGRGYKGGGGEFPSFEGKLIEAFRFFALTCKKEIGSHIQVSRERKNKNAER